MPDINPVISAARRAESSVTSTSDGQVDLRGQQGNLSDAKAAYEMDAGVQDALVNSISDQAKYETQLANARVGAAFGTDMRLQSNVITGAAAAQAEAYQRKVQSSQKIAEFDAKNPLDNIIGSIFDGFARNTEVGNYYSAQRDEHNAAQYLQEINAATSSTIANQKAMEVSMSAASIKAAADKTLDLAQVKALDTRVQGLGYNLDALEITKKASIEQLSIRSSVLQAQNAQEQLRLAQEAADLHRQQFNWQKEAKAGADAGDAYMMERLQTGYTNIMGSSAPDFKNNPALAKKMLAIFKLGDVASADIKAAWVSGGNSSGMVATSAGHLVGMLDAGVGVQFTPAQAPVKSLLEDVKHELDVDTAGKLVDKKTWEANANIFAARKLDAMLKEVKPGDPKNVFNIQSVESILREAPAVAATPFAQIVLAPAIAAKINLDNPATVFTASTEAVKAGKISMADAIDGYTALYQRGVALNLAAKNLPSLGMTPAVVEDPKTKIKTGSWDDYKTTVQTGPGLVWASSQLLNHPNKTDVTRAFMKSAARDINMFNSGNGIPGATP